MCFCRVNKRYVAAIQASLEVTEGPSDQMWIQVFRGLFTGFQLKNISVETCVKDAETTVKKFEDAFTAFENREIYKGLHLVGYALTGVSAAMKDCHIDSLIIAGVEKFIKDIVSCVKGNSFFVCFYSVIYLLPMEVLCQYCYQVK